MKNRRIDLPPNPKTLPDLRAVPIRYQRTLTEEKFLLFDSAGKDFDEEEDAHLNSSSSRAQYDLTC